MKVRFAVLRVGLAVLYVCALLLVPTRSVGAEPQTLAAPSGLSFLELKVTGDEFLVLQNATDQDIADLSRYALYYFNNVNPLSPGTSSSSQMLPATGLAAGESIMLSSSPRQTCGAAVAGDLTLSLGDSAGFLQVVELGVSATGAILQTPGDVVSWSSGSTGIIMNMPSNTKDPLAVFYRYQTVNGYDWQYANLDVANPCQLNAITVVGTVKSSSPTDALLVSNKDTVPGVIVRLAPSSGTTGPGMPVGNFGLKAPKISELLPNVKAPAKDATDEYIEVYNPNDKVFDLSGFILQTGSTTSATRHNYTIPKGTTMPAKAFKVFYSRDTGLSMSNTGGQVWLLDPFATAISHSDPYAKPKDGMAWTTANGKWYYTSTPTPGQTNKVVEPSVASATSKSKTAKTSKGTPVTAVASATVGGIASGATAEQAAAVSTVPIHPTTLAIVLGLGLLYGGYEYRHDLANKVHQLRANRTRRR